MPPVINVHTHFQPSGVEQALEPLGLTWLKNADGSFTFRAGKVEYRMPPTSKRNEGFFGASLHTRLPVMDADGIDVHVLSASPMLFGYDLDVDTAVGVAHAFNDALAADIGRFPDRFWGAAQLPMQDPQMATEELERAVRELGLRSASIGWSYGSERTLAHLDYDEFLAAAVELDVPLMIHPVALGQSMDVAAGGGAWLMSHEVDWGWGYLFVETAAIVGLIFGGALDRHPALRVMVPHGGGMIPYQVGRLEQMARFIPRQAGREPLPRPIADYLKQFYFDSLVHDGRGLKLLIDVMGSDNVVLGTNLGGWDDFPVWDLIRSHPELDDATKAKVLGGNAADRLYRRQVRAPA